MAHAGGIPLCCPACGGDLREEDPIVGRSAPDFGILRCDCSAYPVIAGVPVLMRGRIPGTAATADRLCGLLRSGRDQEALLSATSPPTLRRDQPPQRSSSRILAAIAALRRRRRATARHATWRAAMSTALSDHGNGSARRLFDLYFEAAGRRDTGHYFSYRFGQPRHLAGLSLASLVNLGRGPVLDLGCGAGHIARHVVQQHGARSLVGVDVHLPMLLIGSTRVAPDAHFVCCDVEKGLPFRDATFGNVLMANVLHFLIGKAGCVREMRRVSNPNAILAMSSVRHSLRASETPNAALSLQGYRSLFKDMPLSMLSESELVGRYLNGLGPPLHQCTAPEWLQQEDFIALVASCDLTVFAEHGAFSDWPHAQGRLGINPMYAVVDMGEPGRGLRLTLQWPASQPFADENRLMKHYLAEEAVLGPKIVEALAGDRRIPEMEPLIASFVLLDVPPPY
jgi:SAM-dependent methyltransferase